MPLEQVFDIVADSRNEPSSNPAMTDVELLTQAPIGLGTRFYAHMGKSDMEMIVELTEFERLHRLGSLTTSSMMETSGCGPHRQHKLENDGDGRRAHVALRQVRFMASSPHRECQASSKLTA